MPLQYIFLFQVARMGGVAAEKLVSVKNKAISMMPLRAEDRAELERMEIGFMVMHCVAATAASKW